MKKYIHIFGGLLLLLLLLTGCGKKETEFVTVRVAGLKGPTTMGMVKMIEDYKADSNSSNAPYEFTMFTAADEIVAKLAKGEIDIAAIPANLASILYKKTEGKICVIDINTLGVLYIVENGNQIQEFSDLKGKTVYMTGKGTTPEFVFRYLLEANGFMDEDITIEFKTEATEVAAILESSENAIGLLPQPFATVAAMQNETIHSALDLTEEWDKVQKQETGSLVTGVTVVRKQFLEEYPEAVKEFLDNHKKSTDYVNQNQKEAASLIESYDIVKAAVAEKAIPLCKITFISGEEMKEKLSGYLKVLYEQNPEAVGGQLPDEAFYYIP